MEVTKETKRTYRARTDTKDQARSFRQPPEDFKVQDEMAERCGMSWNAWANEVLTSMALEGKR